MALFKVETDKRSYSNAIYVIAKDHAEAQKKVEYLLRHEKTAKGIFEYDRDGASSIRRDLYNEVPEFIRTIEKLSDDLID